MMNNSKVSPIIDESYEIMAQNNRFKPKGGLKTFFLAIKRGHLLPQLIIQYTTYCNATCPQCGMRKGSGTVRRTLDKDYIKRVIDYAVSQWNIQFLSFTGGEPFLFLDDIIDLINHASNQGIKYIRTGTNGFVFQYDSSRSEKFSDRVYTIAEKLSQTKLYTLWISLDSSEPDIHEEMRGFPGVIKGIEKSIPIFEEFGIYPAVNLGINRNVGGRYNPKEIIEFNQEEFYETYRNGFSKFYQRAIDMGFTIANACYPMSVESERITYQATSQDHIVCFRPEEKGILFKALFDTISQYRSKIRIFTPKVSLYTLIDFYKNGGKTEYPCRGGIDFFYLDAQTGHVYPCGYRDQDDLGEIWNIDIESLRKQKPVCDKCDWECFRDPTELMEPFLDLFRNSFFTKLSEMISREKRRLWIRDLVYFYKCDFFNGRIPPNYNKLKRAL